MYHKDVCKYEQCKKGERKDRATSKSGENAGEELERTHMTYVTQCGSAGHGRKRKLRLGQNKVIVDPQLTQN